MVVVTVIMMLVLMVVGDDCNIVIHDTYDDETTLGYTCGYNTTAGVNGCSDPVAGDVDGTW